MAFSLGRGASSPIDLEARSEYGGVHVTGLVVKKLVASAPFGVVADVVPVEDATIAMKGDDTLVSGFCSTILRVPVATSIAAVDLSVRRPDVHYVDVDPNDPRFWPGVAIDGIGEPAIGASIAPRTAAYRGALTGDGVRVGSVILHAKLGKAILGTAPVPEVTDFNACANYDPIEIHAGS